jgi:hypothetical protein
MNTTFPQLMPRLRFKRGFVFGVLIVSALLSFEIFNYSTTEFALADLLGDLRFMTIRWATILSIAFCGIDFAGIARLFTPEQGAEEPAEVWYLFGAWILAATMNAALTWWGVSIAIINHQSLGNEVMGRETLIRVVPIFVAIMVWLIRILIIGTFSVAGERLFSQSDRRSHRPSSSRQATVRPLNLPRPVPQVSAATFRPAPKATTQPPQSTYFRPEPTYHPMSMSGAAPNKNQQQMQR